MSQGNRNKWVSQQNRQLEMMLLNSSQFAIPKQAPGRLTGWDIILFIWADAIDPSRYTVVVESLDTAGATFRSISKLAATIELPSVKFGPYAQIGAIPDSENLPAFHGRLTRGGTYYLPDTKGQNGIYSFRQSGTHIS